MSPRTHPLSRRAALATLTTSALASPVAAASAAPARPGGHHDRDEMRGHGSRHDHDHHPGHDEPLSPPAGPFTPDCPRGVSCDVRLAAYEQTGDTPQDYANYTLADRRPSDITSIVVHDTEEDYEGTIGIFQDPTSFTSIHYVIREDGHITQMVRVQDMAWHAGNWTFNQSSIGIELIGVAEEPEHFTPAQYRATGALIRHLCRRYDIPRDREHILSHEDLPGTSAESQGAMHWDPGAYYDWSALLEAARIGAPRATSRRLRGTVTIAPQQATNTLAFTSCDPDGGALPARPSSALMVRTAPRPDAPLLADPALAAAGEAGTDRICDWGAQVSSGQSFAIADQRRGWVGLWIGGTIGWVARQDAGGRETVAAGPRRARLVTARRGTTLAIHGVSYPLPKAFQEAGLEPSSNPALPYEITSDQAYVVLDESRGAYYWGPDVDGTGGQWVRDRTRWLRIQLGHRVAFVRADEAREL